MNEHERAALPLTVQVQHEVQKRRLGKLPLRYRNQFPCWIHRRQPVVRPRPGRLRGTLYAPKSPWAAPAPASRSALARIAPCISPVCYSCAEVNAPKNPRRTGKPGSKQNEPPVSAPIRSAIVVDDTWFAISAPGLESALADELRTLPGLSEICAVEGGITFKGPLAAGCAVNLGSRIATRVLVRLGEVQAREFAVLRKRIAALPFEHYLSADRPLRIDASARHCRLYHTGAVAEALQNAVSDRLGAPMQLSKGAESAVASGVGPFGNEPFARLLIRGQDDRFTISVDSSGLLLHLRGARVETGRAPLRETLAAGLLSLAGYRGDEPLVNAMCGAGTIALEAAGIALARAPGRDRHFAFERFPGFEQPSFDALRAQLFSPVRWTATVQALQAQGAAGAFECGPGKVLVGLNKRIVEGLSSAALEDPAGVAQAAQWVRG